MTGFLILRFVLTSCKRHYQDEPKLNGVYSKHDLLYINHWTYIKHFDECKSIGNKWKTFMRMVITQHNLIGLDLSILKIKLQDLENVKVSASIYICRTQT